jgi:hypothetical protein
MSFDFFDGLQLKIGLFPIVFTQQFRRMAHVSETTRKYRSKGCRKDIDGLGPTNQDD